MGSRRQSRLRQAGVGQVRPRPLGGKRRWELEQQAAIVPAVVAGGGDGHHHPGLIVPDEAPAKVGWCHRVFLPRATGATCGIVSGASDSRPRWRPPTVH